MTDYAHELRRSAQKLEGVPCTGDTRAVMRVAADHIDELTRRSDALAATISALSEIVTTQHEIKEAFVDRVRAVLSACPDSRVLHAVEREREACEKLCFDEAKDWAYPSHGNASASMCAKRIRERNQPARGGA